MEHFTCTNTECKAYIGDDACMWRYGDNISKGYQVCPNIVDLLTEKNIRLSNDERARTIDDVIKLLVINHGYSPNSVIVNDIRNLRKIFE